MGPVVMAIKIIILGTWGADETSLEAL